LLGLFSHGHTLITQILKVKLVEDYAVQRVGLALLKAPVVAVGGVRAFAFGVDGKGVGDFVGFFDISVVQRNVVVKLLTGNHTRFVGEGFGGDFHRKKPPGKMIIPSYAKGLSVVP
jgi:hypothetical protein